MQSTDVLGDGPAPGHGECYEQRVEPGIVESFADVPPCRDQDALLVWGNAPEALGHASQLLSPHASSKNDHVFHLLAQSSRQFVEVFIAFRQQ